jgi:hypothetical protein
MDRHRLKERCFTTELKFHGLFQEVAGGCKHNYRTIPKYPAIT